MKNISAKLRWFLSPILALTLGLCPGFAQEVQFEISASASTNSVNTGTAESVLISFFVNGDWTEEETFFEQISNGETISKSFTLTSSPSKVKFIATSDDAWGYWKILLGQEIVLLDPNGEAGTDYGDNPYWLDGDEDAPAEQQYDLQDDWFVSPDAGTDTGETGDPTDPNDPNYPGESGEGEGEHPNDEYEQTGKGEG